MNDEPNSVFTRIFRMEFDNEILHQTALDITEKTVPMFYNFDRNLPVGTAEIRVTEEGVEAFATMDPNNPVVKDILAKIGSFEPLDIFASVSIRNEKDGVIRDAKIHSVSLGLAPAFGSVKKWLKKTEE